MIHYYTQIIREYNQGIRSHQPRSTHNAAPAPTGSAPHHTEGRRISAGDNLLTIHENGQTGQHSRQVILTKEGPIYSNRFRNKNLKYMERGEDFDETTRSPPMKSLTLYENTDTQYVTNHCYHHDTRTKPALPPVDISLGAHMEHSRKVKQNVEEYYISSYDGLDRDTCIEEENKRDITKLEASFTLLGGRYERSLDDNTQLKKRIALLQSEKRSLDQNYRKRIADINNKIMICSSNNELLVLENSELLTNSHILITQLKNERAATKLSKKRSHNKWNVSQDQENQEEVSSDHMIQNCFDTILTLSLRHQHYLEQELLTIRNSSGGQTPSPRYNSPTHRASIPPSSSREMDTIPAARESDSDEETTPSSSSEVVTAVASETDAAHLGTAGVPSEKDSPTTETDTSDHTITNEDITATATTTGVEEPDSAPQSPPPPPLSSTPTTDAQTTPPPQSTRSPARSCIRSAVLRDRRNGLDGTLGREFLSNSTALTAAAANSKAAGKFALAFKRFKSKSSTPPPMCESPSPTVAMPNPLVPQHTTSR